MFKSIKRLGQIIKINATQAVILAILVLLFFFIIYVDFSPFFQSLKCSSSSLVAPRLKGEIFDWVLLDKFITSVTFSLAALIGWQGYVRRWEDKLPNKLTVHFICGGKVIMSCFNATLSGKDDARNWGQQIGSQMGNPKNWSKNIDTEVNGVKEKNNNGAQKDSSRLAIQPSLEQQPMEIINNDHKLYVVKFYLSSEPEIFTAESLNNKYLTWVIDGIKITKSIHERLDKHQVIDFASAKNNGTQIKDEPDEDEQQESDHLADEAQTPESTATQE